MTVNLTLIIILFTAMVIGAIVKYITVKGGKVSILPIPGMGLGFQFIEDYVNTDEYGLVKKSTLFIELVFIYITVEVAEIVPDEDSDDEPENLAYGD